MSLSRTANPGMMGGGAMPDRVVPESATSLRLPRVVYRPLKGSDQIIELACAYRPDDRSPILQSFLEVVRQFRSASEATA